MLPLTGYADRLSVRPGETIRFHLSNATGADVEAKIVRVVCADANPAGPGVLLEPVATAPVRCGSATEQRSPQGSYARIESPARCFGASGFSVTCLVHPTRLAGTRQVIASRTGAGAKSGFVLAIDEEGRLSASFGDGTSMRDVAVVPEPLVERAWHAVWLLVDTESGEVGAGWALLSPRLGESASPRAVRATLPADAAPATDAPLLLAAADHAHPTHHFNGKLEAPAVFDRPLTAEEIDQLAGGGTPAGASARWDFSRGVGTGRIDDTGPHELHGTLVNVPGRGMTGSQWTGREMCWRHAPREVRGHPLPRGRHRRLRLAGRVRVDGACGHALVHLRASPWLPEAPRTTSRSSWCRRSERPPHPSPSSSRPSPTPSTRTRPAPSGRAIRSGRRAGRRRPPGGAPTRTIPATTRSTASRPTTTTPTAAASPSRPGTGRC